MKKRMSILLLSLFVTLCACMPTDVFATDGEDVVEQEHTAYQYKIEEYNGEMAAIITGCSFVPGNMIADIPQELEGYPVRVIGKGALEGQEELILIEVPEGVVEIEDSAFEGCSNVTQVSLPSSVQKIGGAVFLGCGSHTKNGVSLTVYKDSYAHTYAESQGIDFSIVEWFAYYDLETYVEVQVCDTSLYKHTVTLKADVITEGEEYDVLTKNIEQDALLYKLSMEKDGEAFVPTTDLKISMTLPNRINGYYCTVYRVEPDSALTELKSYLGKAGWDRRRFSDTSLGTYLLVGQHMFGDLDNDCEITANDALKALKMVVKLESYNEAQKETADVDDNGEITAEDALWILRRVVKMGEFPVIDNIPS